MRENEKEKEGKEEEEGEEKKDGVSNNGKENYYSAEKERESVEGILGYKEKRGKGMGKKTVRREGRSLAFQRVVKGIDWRSRTSEDLLVRTRTRRTRTRTRAGPRAGRTGPGPGPRTGTGTRATIPRMTFAAITTVTGRRRGGR
jgi:hypothetical protein